MALNKVRNQLGTQLVQLLKSIKEYFNQNGNNSYEQILSITHPAQAVMEVCPAAKIRGYNMIDYKKKSSSPIWAGDSWDQCSGDIISYGEVGQTSYFGLNLCSVGHSNSRHIAKKKSSSIFLFCVLNDSEDLRSKLDIMAKALADHDK